MTHQGQINVGGPGVQRMPPAILHGWFYVPYAAIGSREALDGEKKRLTFVPKFAEPEDPPIRLYRDLPSRGYLGVPKAYGLSRYPWLQIDDRRTSGVEIERAPRLPDPNHPRVKDPAQQAAFMQSLLQAANQHESFVAKADTGCHAAGTEILMYDGTVKRVEDIRFGDLVMGPDSKPRTVLRTVKGRQMMYRVAPLRGGAPFVVNEDHILSLTRTRTVATDLTRAGEIVNVSVKEWLAWAPRRKHLHKLRRLAVDFPAPRGALSLDPYFLGLWLGDGASRHSAITTADAEIQSYVAAYHAEMGEDTRVEAMANNRAVNVHARGSRHGSGAILSRLKGLGLVQNKHIPHRYLTGSRDVRWAVLAGLVDSDGHLTGNGIEIVQKRERLARDIIFLARSLGLRATISDKAVNGDVYQRIMLSGDFADMPVLLDRKRPAPAAQKKNPLVSGFTVEAVGEGDFYGFALSGDHLYLTADFTAHHNTGKTVCALWLSQQLLRRTTILVPLERLMDQWLEEIRDKLGLPEERIGRVQGPTCQFEGKDVIVGMMHSLSMRNSYPPEFFRSVGLVVYDECHRVGSAVLSRCASLFPAQYQLALSATPDRADGGDRVVYWHVGPVRVVSKAPALECTVYVKRYRTRRELYGKHPQSRAKCLSQDPDRNRMIVDLILRNWRIGRNILVIGKFIDHLQDLMEACIRAGIPVTDMGQFTGQQNVRQTVMTHEGPRRRTVRSMKVQKTEYDRIKAESRIIFATYGVFKEGIDVPRLDCGIDVLPQSAATQVIGRIRRPMEGKPTPYWITILDEECAFSQSMFIKRVKDYRATGCRIVDNGRV
ncbi:Hint domain-containing homing endonuclease [Paracoccus sp. MKU1]|uniref:Hint domain-containing homing endonuclease n=1 Tax=Paracoccus sp. MKU1 TaxID=1745182 RepID=UPI00071938B3|nr:Hint domain-containing homing endonuclease [Paracoccus sp. MKU1]KRW94270.1 hypothetical protein AQY21_20280 [Paracoccus sp. MKU1]